MSDCCCCCCNWCINGGDSRDEKHDSRGKGQYQQLSGGDIASDIDVVLPQYEKVPVDKIFQFEQPMCPVYVHPQLIGDDRSNIVTRQPQPATSEKVLVNEPSVLFSLYYDFQRRVLSVHLHSALYLLGGAASGKQQLTHIPLPVQGAARHERLADSFIMLFLVPHKEQVFYSAVVTKSNNPSFDEVFEFTGLLSNEIRRQFLVFRVFDKSKPMTQNELGTVILPLENADLYGVSIRKSIKSMADQEDTDILNQFDSNGDVLVSLMHDPSVSIISGVLLKARNLQKMDIGGLSDPYVKIYLLHKGTRKCKWKSTIKKRSLAPIYNEPFQFDVAGMDIHYVRLQLTMFDYDILGSDDVMGTMEFGVKSSHHTGRLHWSEMASSPRNQVCFWHTMEKPSCSTLKRLSLK